MRTKIFKDFRKIAFKRFEKNEFFYYIRYIKEKEIVLEYFYNESKTLAGLMLNNNFDCFEILEDLNKFNHINYVS